MNLPKRHVPTLLTVQKVWDIAPHNAMTDLIRYKNRWYCVFREGNKHVHGGHGQIRLLASQDAILWQSVAVFQQDGVDLRDPKLSITPTGQLMLLAGGTIYDEEDKYVSLQSRVTFSQDGVNWTLFQTIIQPHEWLWRLTWYQGRAYGASYSRSDPKNKKKEWNIKLFDSVDGINWSLITTWDIPGYPNETTLRFSRTGEMIAFVRRDKPKDNNAWLGRSLPPYNEWEWQVLNYYVGGPNFLLLPDESILLAGRMLTDTPYGQLENTFIGSIEENTIQRLLVVPSGGDCSYPGLYLHENVLWMSYYSSHESNAAIYLARVAL